MDKLTVYKNKSRKALKDMREHCDSDQFIIDCRVAGQSFLS